MASASITPLDWEPAHASHVALERQKDKKQTNKQKKPKNLGVPIMVQWLMNPTRNHEFAGSIPGLAQWVMDLALLWLWRRPAATAPIRPLAWEPPYAVGAALKKTKRQNK